MQKVVKLSEVKEEDFGAIKVRNIFHPQNLETVSVAIIRIEGINRRHKNDKSDSFFYVIGGTGSYTIGNEVREVSSGDSIFIPKGMDYVDSGQMQVLAVSFPAYDETQIHYLE